MVLVNSPYESLPTAHFPLTYRARSYRRYHSTSVFYQQKSFIDCFGILFRIALGVIVSWGMTIYKQFGLLAGKSAPHEFLQLVIFKAAIFSDEIEKVDTIRAYHASLKSLIDAALRWLTMRGVQSRPNYFVEVDVVMDANTSLRKAHDLSQQRQDRIEVLPNVGRAFVHVDHETSHAPVSPRSGMCRGSAKL